MRCPKVLPGAALAALLVGCANDVPTPAEEMLTESVHAGGVERAFKADVQGLGSFELRQEGRCRTMDVPIVTVSTGRGQATHLGLFAFSSSHCFELPVAAPPPYGTMERGEWTFVSADGDELYATYEGVQLSALFSNPTYLASDLTFTGGTGRFSNASGWAHAEGRIEVPANPDTDPWPLYLTLEGRISY
jgi:hypothetical protein